MNHLLYHAILLAQRSRLDSLSSGFRGRRARFDTQDIVTFLLIVAGIIVAVWGVSYLLRIQERRRGHASPLRLFFSLCKAHRLRWSEWWLLWRVARAQRLRDPARLFLEPERLEAVALGRWFQTRQAQLKQIRDRLFAQLEEAAEQPGDEPPEMPGHQHAGTPPSPVPPNPTPDIPPWTPTPRSDADIPTPDSLYRRHSVDPTG